MIGYAKGRLIANVEEGAMLLPRLLKPKDDVGMQLHRKEDPAFSTVDGTGCNNIDKEERFQGHCERSIAIELMCTTSVQVVTIAFKDKPTLTYTLQWQKWINPPLTNEEILD